MLYSTQFPLFAVKLRQNIFELFLFLLCPRCTPEDFQNQGRNKLILDVEIENFFPVQFGSGPYASDFCWIIVLSPTALLDVAEKNNQLLRLQQDML